MNERDDNSRQQQELEEELAWRQQEDILLAQQEIRRNLAPRPALTQQNCYEQGFRFNPITRAYE